MSVKSTRLILMALNCITEEEVHYAITCDQCDVGPICGRRYKCSECLDYDLCGECKDKGFHNHHTMVRRMAGEKQGNH